MLPNISGVPLPDLGRSVFDAAEINFPTMCIRGYDRLLAADCKVVTSARISIIHSSYIYIYIYPKIACDYRTRHRYTLNRSMSLP